MIKVWASISFLLVIGVGCNSDETSNENRNNNDMNSEDASIPINVEDSLTLEKSAFKNDSTSINKESENQLNKQDYTYQPTNENHSYRFEAVSFGSYMPKFQDFEINTNRDTVIKTENNNLIFIPANCFKFKRSDKTVQSVKISIREFMEYSEILSTNFTTTSTQKSHLRSGGMFEILAKSNGAELELKPFQELVLQPNGSLEDGMHIFHGKELQDFTYWEKDRNSREPYPSMVCVDGKLCGVSRNFFEYNFRFDKGEMLKLTEDTTSFTVSFGNNGEIIGYEVCNKTESIGKNQACTEFLKLAAQLNDSIPGSFENHWESYFGFQVMKYDSYKAFRAKKEQERRDFEANKKIKELIVNSDNVVRKDNNYELFYKKRPSLFIGGLGPINIDIELVPPELPKGEIRIAKNGIKGYYRLLMKSGKSVIAPFAESDDLVQFKQLPRNRTMVFISTYTKNDQIYFCKKEIKTSKLVEINNGDLNYVPVDNMQDLKRKIDAI